MFRTLIHAAWFQAGVLAMCTAAHVDILAFRSWKRWHDLVEYDWSVATFRWAQGFAIGAIGWWSLKLGFDKIVAPMMGG